MAARREERADQKTNGADLQRGRCSPLAGLPTDSLGRRLSLERPEGRPARNQRPMECHRVGVALRAMPPDYPYWSQPLVGS